jgi:hypothetical protein
MNHRQSSLSLMALGSCMVLASGCIKKSKNSNPDSFRDSSSGVYLFEELQLPHGFQNSTQSSESESLGKSWVGSLGVCYYSQKTGETQGTRVTEYPIALAEALKAASFVLNQNLPADQKPAQLEEDFAVLLEAVFEEAAKISEENSSVNTDTGSAGSMNVAALPAAGSSLAKVMADPVKRKGFFHFFRAVFARVGKTSEGSASRGFWQTLQNQKSKMASIFAKKAKVAAPAVSAPAKAGWWQNSPLKGFLEKFSFKKKTPVELEYAPKNKKGFNPFKLAGDMMSFHFLFNMMNPDKSNPVTAEQIENFTPSEFDDFLKTGTERVELETRILASGGSTEQLENTLKISELLARLEVVMQNMEVPAEGKAPALVESFESLAKSDSRLVFKTPCAPNANPTEGTL